MNINITEGNYYIARNGELVGPMEVNDYAEDRPPFLAEGYGWYDANGKHGYQHARASGCDIIDTVDHAAQKSVEGRV